MNLARNQTESLLGNSHQIPLSDRHFLLNNLFLDLQAYLKHRDVDVHASTMQFFDDLFPLVFHHILKDPSGTTLTPQYRECLIRVRRELYPNPFGEAPRRMAHGLHKSFLAARSLLDALVIGIEVVNTTDYLGLESQCTRALTKLQYCPVCRGYASSTNGGPRPCRLFCYNVMRGCLSSVSQVDPHWNTYVDNVRQLSLRMRDSYDLERVMHRVFQDVSDAIMHAMETGHKFYPRVSMRHVIVRSCKDTMADHSVL